MPLSGAHAVFVAAPITYRREPTQQLLETYAPDVPRLRPLEGHEVAIDLTVAKTLLGFRAEHLLDVDEIMAEAEWAEAQPAAAAS